MYQYKVGGYLYGQPRTMKDCCILNYDPSGPTLVIAMTGMTTEEAKAIKNGKMEFALFEKEGVLFLLIRIPGIMDWSDAPFHIGLYSDSRQVPEYISDGQGWGLTIVGVESRNGIIRALRLVRLVGLGTEISREMIRIIRKQGRTNQVDHHNKVRRIYRKYSCQDMVNRAIARYQVGDRL